VILEQENAAAKQDALELGPVTRESSGSAGGERRLKEFGVGLPVPPEPFGTARRIVAKHERAHEMFYLDRVKPRFSRDRKAVRRTKISPSNAIVC
jgi:hypothetical protein